jgi:hypothetical protein
MARTVNIVGFMKTKLEGKSGCSYGCETFADNDSKCQACKEGNGKTLVTMVLVHVPETERLAQEYRIDLYFADDDTTRPPVTCTRWYRTKLTALAQGIFLIADKGWEWDGRCGMVTL